MSAKTYLQQIKGLDIRITQKQEELERLRCTMRAVSTDSGGGSGSPSDPTGNTAARCADLMTEIQSDLTALAELRGKIINQIQALDDTRFVQILYLRYVQYQSLEQIAVGLHYSYEHVRHLHGYALLEFDRLFP